MRRGIIDIGTNSVKLLLADIAGNEIIPLLEQSRQTRLGCGFYGTGKLEDSSIQATVEAVTTFFSMAMKHQCESVRVIATSAVREAANRSELLGKIHATTKLETDVLSGEDEAKLIFAGVRSDDRFAGKPLLVADAGGGSTELIVGDGRSIVFHQSLGLGSVRLMESHSVSDQPLEKDLANIRATIEDILKRQAQSGIEPHLKSFFQGTPQLVGTGGMASIFSMMSQKLATFDRERVESAMLPLEEVEDLCRRLWELPLEQRKHIPGLPPNRADVALMGSLIFEQIMRRFQFTTLQVSTRGVRFGALL